MHVGDEGVARLGGRWTKARITAVHPTGTLSVIEPDGGFMSDWHSVCAHDWSGDELERLAALAGGDRPVGPEDVGRWFADVGVPIAGDALEGWWASSSQQLFGDVQPTRSLAEVHALLLGAGWSAKALDPRAPRDVWHPMWWNQVRMGGARPEDGPPVDLDGARAALGLEALRDDAADAAVAAFEQAHGVRVPDELRALHGLQGFAAAFRDAHCNNPEWRDADAWVLLQGLRARGLPGDLGVECVDPHQGDHTWVVVFDPGDTTGAVALRHPTPDGGDGFIAAAPSLAFWIWDLERAGADWLRGMAGR